MQGVGRRGHDRRRQRARLLPRPPAGGSTSPWCSRPTDTGTTWAVPCCTTLGTPSARHSRGQLDARLLVTSSSRTWEAAIGVGWLHLHDPATLATPGSISFRPGGLTGPVHGDTPLPGDRAPHRWKGAAAPSPVRSSRDASPFPATPSCSQAMATARPSGPNDAPRQSRSSAVGRRLPSRRPWPVDPMPVHTEDSPRPRYATGTSRQRRGSRPPTELVRLGTDAMRP